MAELFFGLDAATRQSRQEKEAAVRAIIEDMRQRQARGEPVSDPLAAHRLLYPTISPEEARRRRELYGAVKWTEQALAVAARESPLVEVGAGRGQWQKALEGAGADVLAFDNMSSPATNRGFVGKVSRGDETVLQNHANRSLLLVYPNPGPMARNCLDNYSGDTLVYIGEGRGGVNGDDQFFDILGREWELATTAAVDTLCDCHEHLYVLRRRKRSAPSV